MTEVSSRRFVALVRWRSAITPELELETHHAGFLSAEAAALAANGLGAQGFDELVLDHGTLTIQREGVAVAGAGGPMVIAWISVGPPPAGVPREWAFERIEGGLAQVGAVDRAERFTPSSFRVIDQTTGEDIGIDFLITRSRITVLITRSITGRKRSAMLLT